MKGEAGTELADGARRTEASSGVPAASPQSKVPSGWHTKPGQNWFISVEGNAWLIPNRLLNTEKSPRNLLAALHLWAGPGLHVLVPTRLLFFENFSQKHS